MTDETLPLTHDEPLAVQLKLRVISGPDFGRELVVERGSYTIGREPRCDFALNDPSVSRMHLVAQAVQGAIKLVDNDSANGSFVRGQRFTALDALPGTEVTFGKTTLRVEPVAARAPVIPPSERTEFGELIGRSVAMRQTFALLERVARTDTDLLLQGETGTGKEAAARAVHQHSKRSRAPWIVVDFTTLSPNLLESELFGHVRGAFTGATADRPGPFELAHGGTLFLDGLHELPLELQSRLLRALERREVRRVGASDWRRLDVRVIASTRTDLEGLVRRGTFREDLFFRLAAAHVILPPLRDRPEDVPLLAAAFANQLGKQLSDLSPESRALMISYGWPGNLRELKNVVEQALQLGTSPFVAPGVGSQELAFKEAKERLVALFEKEYLERLMDRSEQNLSRAARESGIGRLHLRRLLRKHRLRDDGPEPEDDGAE